MNFLDCLNNNVFDNYWFLDGISDKLGYSRFKEVQLVGNITEVEKAPKEPLTLLKTAITITKILSMLAIVIPLITQSGTLACVVTTIVPTLMLTGKIISRMTHEFKEISTKKPRVAADRTQTVLKTAEQIRVGTYNILYPQKFKEDGKTPAPFSTNIGYKKDSKGNLTENSKERVQIIAENIIFAGLDVLCLQEVDDTMGEALAQYLKSSYRIKWEKHPGKEHGVGILYLKDKFQEIFSSSLTVEVEVEDATKPGTYLKKKRVHLLCDIQDKTTKKVFRVVSCHMFDPRSLKDKQEQTQKVLDFAKPTKTRIHRIIVAGDMNQDQFGDVSSTIKPASPSEQHATSFKPFVKNGYQVDGNYESSEYKQEYPGEGELKSKERHIDWIWVKGKSKPLHIPTLTSFDKKGSNHLLVASVIT